MVCDWVGSLTDKICLFHHQYHSAHRLNFSSIFVLVEHFSPIEFPPAYPSLLCEPCHDNSPPKQLAILPPMPSSSLSIGEGRAVHPRMGSKKEGVVGLLRQLAWRNQHFLLHHLLHCPPAPLPGPGRHTCYYWKMSVWLCVEQNIPWISPFLSFALCYFQSSTVS